MRGHVRVQTRRMQCGVLFDLLRDVSDDYYAWVNVVYAVHVEHMYVQHMWCMLCLRSTYATCMRAASE